MLKVREGEGGRVKGAALLLICHCSLHHPAYNRLNIRDRGVAMFINDHPTPSLLPTQTTPLMTTGILQ